MQKINRVLLLSRRLLCPFPEMIFYRSNLCRRLEEVFTAKTGGRKKKKKESSHKFCLVVWFCNWVLRALSLELWRLGVSTTFGGEENSSLNRILMSSGILLIFSRIMHGLIQRESQTSDLHSESTFNLSSGLSTSNVGGEKPHTRMKTSIF